MGFSYIYNAETNIVYTVATGEITVSDIIEHMQGLILDSSIKPGFIEVVDFENAANLTLSYMQTDNLLEVWKGFSWKGCQGVIIYAPSDVIYGSFKMLKMSQEVYAEDMAENAVIIRSKAEIDETVKSLRSRD